MMTRSGVRPCASDRWPDEAANSLRADFPLPTILPSANAPAVPDEILQARESARRAEPERRVFTVTRGRRTVTVDARGYGVGATGARE